MRPGAQFGRVFDDETTQVTDKAAAPDYSFEGYTVEFLDKVALLPVTDPLPVATGR
jgi:hypothetical protein